VAAPDETVTARGRAREQVLHATIELIGADGVAAVSNRRVAAAAGVSLGSLTYHFPDQSRLLHEALVLYAEEEIARYAETAARLRAEGASPESAVVEVQRAIAASAARRTAQIAELELHLHASRNPELQDASRRCFDAYDDFAAAVLEALGLPDPERNAKVVVALIAGLGLRRLGTGEEDLDTPARALEAILRGVQGG
jgi:DNA-binding transcriptional regulator YbjK